MAENIWFSADFLRKVEKELQEIKDKDYQIGDVSQDMKNLVNAVYGDEDWSTSGYWMRAQDFFSKRKGTK